MVPLVVVTNDVFVVAPLPQPARERRLAMLFDAVAVLGRGERFEAVDGIG
jgi:hypothetical protein